MCRALEECWGALYLKKAGRKDGEKMEEREERRCERREEEQEEDEREGKREEKGRRVRFCWGVQKRRFVSGY